VDYDAPSVATRGQGLSYTLRYQGMKAHLRDLIVTVGVRADGNCTAYDIVCPWCGKPMRGFWTERQREVRKRYRCRENHLVFIVVDDKGEMMAWE